MKVLVIGWILLISVLPARAEPTVFPVMADGWVIAGNKTVGTAVRLMRIGMWDEAQSELQKLLGYRPRNHAAQYNMGLCYERQGDYERARTYYEKAMDLWPESMYCEGLARIDSLAGTGAEFLKFLVPCSSSCRTGYLYARAGMWREAITRFDLSLSTSTSAAAALNMAVAAEVLGNRAEARQIIQKASALAGDPRYDAFELYLVKSPELPLDMLTSMPELTTTTDSPVLTTMIATRNNTPVRLESDSGSPVLELLTRGARVDVLTISHSWVRVRTVRQKEGYVPAVDLSTDLDNPDSSGVYSMPWENEASVIETPVPVFLELTPEVQDRSVKIASGGKPVLVRREPSLIAEVAGSLEDGSEIEVKECGDERWLEIVAGPVTGYIMKQFTVTVGNNANAEVDDVKSLKIEN